MYAYIYIFDDTLFLLTETECEVFVPVFFRLLTSLTPFSPVLEIHPWIKVVQNGAATLFLEKGLSDFDLQIQNLLQGPCDPF